MKSVRYRIMFFLIIVVVVSLYSRENTKVRYLKWRDTGDILVTLENDSGFILDINDLFHSQGSVKPDIEGSITYYPVALAENFIDQFKEKNIDLDTAEYDQSQTYKKYNTLWSAVHSTLGGGWVHFANSLIYSLESGQLQLTAPLLKRSDSKWKPKPMTKSYKRTKKWEYYIPESQKLAIKEYKIKAKEGTLGDIANLPQEYIDLFLETNDNEYKELQYQNNKSDLAKIDMVKILLGANYLGIPQIHYIKSMVLKSVLHYSIKNPIPSVIIFDDLQAAVAMKLDTYGYHIENVAFKDEERLSEKELENKMKMLNTIVSGINEINKRHLQEKLKKYYD